MLRVEVVAPSAAGRGALADQVPFADAGGHRALGVVRHGVPLGGVALLSPVEPQHALVGGLRMISRRLPTPIISAVAENCAKGAVPPGNSLTAIGYAMPVVAGCAANGTRRKLTFLATEDTESTEN